MEGVRTGGVPAAARLLDAVAVAALAVAAVVLVSGGFVLRLGSFRVSSHSFLRPLIFATVVIVTRHAIWRNAVPLHHRLHILVRGLRSDSRASIVTVALSSRVGVLLVGYFAVLIIGFSQPLGFRVSRDPLGNLPARFDAGWYGGIALDGYRFEGRFDAQQNIAFFPAYPALMRIGGFVIGATNPRAPEEYRLARMLWMGTIISIAAFAWAALYVRRLTRDIVGEEHAAGAVALLAAYPFAVFYSAAYTESLFLLGTVATFYHFRRREWGAAAAWGLVVGLTRPNGSLLSVVLVCLIAEHLWRRTRTGDYFLGGAVLAASMPGLGMLAYASYVRYLTGDWLGWTRVQQAWGRSFEGLPAIGETFEALENGAMLRVVAGAPAATLDALALLFAVSMLWLVFRRLGLAAGAFVVMNLAPAMLAGGVLSMGRFTATLFPIFIALAAALPRPLVVPCITAWAIGQGLVAALFFTWRPPF